MEAKTTDCMETEPSDWQQLTALLPYQISSSYIHSLFSPYSWTFCIPFLQKKKSKSKISILPFCKGVGEARASHCSEVLSKKQLMIHLVLWSHFPLQHKVSNIYRISVPPLWSFYLRYISNTHEPLTLRSLLPAGLTLWLPCSFKNPLTLNCWQHIRKLLNQQSLGCNWRLSLPRPPNPSSHHRHHLCPVTQFH